jgi:hypothetical protein
MLKLKLLNHQKLEENIRDLYKKIFPRIPIQKINLY